MPETLETNDTMPDLLIPSTTEAHPDPNDDLDQLPVTPTARITPTMSANFGILAKVVDYMKVFLTYLFLF